MDSDHYAVLGLPSGEEGAKLSEKEITRAFRIKALELHPDKRPNDRNAQANFQKLKDSYEILKDEKARKQFDDLVRAKREQRKRRSNRESNRDAMMSDLEARERGGYASEIMKARKEKEEEERTMKKFQEELAEYRARYRRKREEEFAQQVKMQAERQRSAAAAATPPPPPPQAAAAGPIPSRFREDAPWKTEEGFQAYEDEVLQKLRMAAQRQKMALGKGMWFPHP